MQVQQTAVVLDMGTHMLHSERQPLKLYQALPLAVAARLRLQPPLRSLKQLGCVVLGAPVGEVAIAFMNVAGAAVLDVDRVVLIVILLSNVNPQVLLLSTACLETVLVGALSVVTDTGDSRGLIAGQCNATLQGEWWHEGWRGQDAAVLEA